MSNQYMPAAIIFSAKPSMVNVADAIAHLANHAELYWEVGFPIAKEKLSFPLLGFIHIVGKQVEYRVTISDIVPFDSAHYENATLATRVKPESWRRDWKNDSGGVRSHKWQSTLIITQIEPYIRETKSFRKYTGGHVKLAPQKYVRIIAPGPVVADAATAQRKSAIVEKTMTTIQHSEAKRLLPIIESAVTSHKLLTYGSAAARLGRDPKTNSRMVAQVCDLLDAAAALADVPLLALVTVREKSGEINRKAWAGDDLQYREPIIQRSLQHRFGKEDFLAINEALGKLDGKSNREAWKFVRDTIPSKQLYLRLAGSISSDGSDAIDDIGTDTPTRVPTSGTVYARDPKIRAAVKLRAAGKCEYCGQSGFICPDGTAYLECHHIIALANDGADRMTNVIALCPGDHREAHFGKRRAELEKEMIRKVKIAERARR